MSPSKTQCKAILKGLLFVLLFALASSYLAELPWLVKSGLSSLVIAIVLGITFSNSLGQHLPKEWTPGIQYAAKQLLRVAIVLYGFRISFQQIASVGILGLGVDFLVVSLTLILGTLIGVKIFKLDRHLALLISAGSAICGAAAVLATEEVLKCGPYKTTVAIGTVVLFGTTAMFLDPLLQHLGLLNFTDSQFGLFAGASIHEVAQALVAGNNVSPEAGNLAVIVKMTRVLLLVPALLFLSLYENRLASTKGSSKKIIVPWFAVYFVVMIGFNSLALLPVNLVHWLNQLDIFLLTMAMAAIGIETNLSKIKKVGLKPLYLALFLFCLLNCGVYSLIKIL